MKKIVILAGSPRKQGNTYKLVDAFQQGINDYEVKVLPIGNMKIHSCMACEFCHTAGNGKCLQKDDMAEVANALMEADAVVIASPVYYLGLSGQMQNCLSRWYAFRKPAKAVKYALLLASGSANVYGAIETQIKGLAAHFEAEFVGTVTTSMEENNLNKALDSAKALAEKF